VKPRLHISDPQRPFIPGYGISEESAGLLSWEDVVTWMGQSKNYWISTTRPDGHPHARPIWGIFLENILYVGGGSTTRSFKNLHADPRIVAHTESGSQTVIIEGMARLFDDQDLADELSTAYEKKYNQPHPPPFYGIIPAKVFAWTIDDYANTPTKWNIKEIEA